MQSITHKRVLGIAVPIVISNITVPILGAVDTGVIGQLGQATPIGAVGIGALILTTFYWFFGFLRMGTTGLTSQAVGAQDSAEIDAILSRVLFLGFGAGLAVIILQVPLFALAFMVSPAASDVEAMARDYMQIRIWGAPFAIAIYGITGWLIAQERTKAVLVLQVGMNLLNIGLDFLFVLGMSWGVEGVAYATLIAEVSGCAIGLWFAQATFKGVAWRGWSRVFDGTRLMHMMLVNRDILIRTLMLQVIFVSFTLVGSGFDTVTLAANQVLLQFLMITAYALDGFAFSVETLVGQGVGARNRRAVRQAARLVFFWGAMIALVFAASFAVLGPLGIDIMTTAQDVRQEARTYLIYMVFAPILGMASWVLDGIFIGATRTRDMRNMMAISAAIYICAAVLLVPSFENHGLWIALLISFVARGVTLGLRYPALERAI